MHFRGRTRESFYDVAHEHPNGRVFKYHEHEYNDGRFTVHKSPGAKIRRISYGDLDRMTGREPDTWPMSGQIFVHSSLIYGDYTMSSPVERSNVGVFLEEHGDHPDVYEIYGGYGTRGVGVALSCNSDDIRETLEALDAYPILDEDHWCQLERELEEEALSDYALDEFWSELVGRYDDRNELYTGDDFLLDEWEEREKRQLFEWAMEESGTYWIHEDPNVPYIDTSRMAEAVTLEMLLP